MGGGVGATHLEAGTVQRRDDGGLLVRRGRDLVQPLLLAVAHHKGLVPRGAGFVGRGDGAYVVVNGVEGEDLAVDDLARVAHLVGVGASVWERQVRACMCVRGE